MSDIVSRLRAFDCVTMDGCGADLRCEAAEEVERLRLLLSAEQSRHANSQRLVRRLKVENRDLRRIILTASETAGKGDKDAACENNAQCSFYRSRGAK